MVHFTDKLRSNAIKRWGSHYMDYKALKKAIKRVAEGEDAREDDAELRDPDPTVVDILRSELEDVGIESPAFGKGKPGAAVFTGAQRKDNPGRALRNLVDGGPEVDFVRLLLAEMRKVESFYASKTRHYASHLDLIRQQLSRHASSATRLGMHEYDDDSDEEEPPAARARLRRQGSAGSVAFSRASPRPGLVSPLRSGERANDAPASLSPIGASLPSAAGFGRRLSPLSLSHRRAATPDPAARAPAPVASLAEPLLPPTSARAETAPIQRDGFPGAPRRRPAPLPPVSPSLGPPAPASAGGVTPAPLPLPLPLPAGSPAGLARSPTQRRTARAAPPRLARTCSAGTHSVVDGPPPGADASETWDERSEAYQLASELGTEGAQEREGDDDDDDDDGATQRMQRSAASLKRALVTLYRSMAMLRNFAMLNYTGFVKILKKHDKKTGIHLSAFVHPLLETQTFQEAAGLNTLIEKVESLFAHSFAGGNFNIARSELLVRQHGGTDWRDVQLGLRVGLGAMLLFWMAWDCVVDAAVRPAGDRAERWITTMVPVYRCLGCVVLMFWCWGLNLFVWTTARVNYLYLFELDPARTMTYDQVFEKAGILSAAYCTSFLLFYKVVRGEVFFNAERYASLFPLAFAVLLLYELLRPWRRDFAWSIRNLVIAPFGAVTFFTAYTGDVFTSLVKVFTDLAYTLCYFASGEFITLDGATTCHDAAWLKTFVTPLCCALPLWFRMHQNFRRYHDTGKRFPSLANAFKYAFAHSVVLFGVFHPDFKTTNEAVTVYQALWILSLALSTLYTYSWDVVMDWGLGNREHGFLRDRLMYRNRAVYFAAIAADFFLRFLWTLTLLPSRSGLLTLTSYLDPFLAAAEICRRCMWGIFRIENEHLNNTEGYRRVDFVPLHFETATPKGQRPAEQQRTARNVVCEIAVMTGVVIALGVVAVLSAR